MWLKGSNTIILAVFTILSTLWLIYNLINPSNPFPLFYEKWRNEYRPIIKLGERNLPIIWYLEVYVILLWNFTVYEVRDYKIHKIKFNWQDTYNFSLFSCSITNKWNSSLSTKRLQASKSHIWLFISLKKYKVYTFICPPIPKRAWRNIIFE